MLDLDRLLRGADLWDKRYLEAVIAAIKEYQQPKAAAKNIRKYLSKETCAEFNLTNPYSRKIIREQLLEAAVDLEEPLFERGAVVMLATFADNAWACCDRAIDFDLDAAKQKIRNALVGMDYLGVFEAAVYPGEKWTTDGKAGCLISFHCHVFIWGTSQSKLRRLKAKIKNRFEAIDPENLGHAFPVLNHLKTVKDLQRTLRYATKMPFNGYRKVIKNERLTQEYAQLGLEHHYRLAGYLRRYTVFDAWFSGGKCTAILRAVRKSSLDRASSIMRKWQRKQHEKRAPPYACNIPPRNT
jgi:hypothetical protein